MNYLTIGEFLQINLAPYSYLYIYFPDGGWNKYSYFDVIPEESLNYKFTGFSVHCENNVPMYYFYI